MECCILAVILSLIPLCSSLQFEPVYPANDINDTRTDLFIGLIQAFGFNNTFNSSGAIPAVQLALDMINNNPDILSGYKLNYVLMDSQV